VRIVIPYTPARLAPRTRAWGEANGAEFRDTSADTEAYFRLLAELWRDGEAFMLVDHDIVPPPDAVQRFAACAEDVCCHPFLILGMWSAAEELGCTRFSRVLVRKYPNLVDESPGAFLGGCRRV